MGPILAIMGATATGKSRLAFRLALELGGEIVNADALQVYRGFDIGTAKPSAEQRLRVRHHLIDILEPHERYSAGEFARRARTAVAEIHARRRLPIAVGGSGLYLRALLDGISPLPAVDAEVRRRLEERLLHEGLGALRAELEAVDPRSAARLAPGDTQRTLRALEVAHASGHPLSEWIARRPSGAGTGVSAVRLGLTLPRAILYDHIADRVREMVRAGWVDEIRRLLNRGLDPSLPAFQAIGYRQLARYASGEWSLDEALDETIRATRRFAKRQETWFRKERGVEWFPAHDLDRQLEWILQFVVRSGLGRAR